MVHLNHFSLQSREPKSAKALDKHFIGGAALYVIPAIYYYEHYLKTQSPEKSFLKIFVDSFETAVKIDVFVFNRIGPVIQEFRLNCT